MKDIDNCNKAGDKNIHEYKNLFGQSIADEPMYLEMIRNKITF